MTDRICFVLLTAYGYFDPSVTRASGGGGRQYHMLSRALADSHDIHFVVGDYGQPRRETRDGVTLHRAYRPDEAGGLTQKPRQLYALYQAMRRADADVYVYRGYPWKAAFVYALARSLGVEWVYNLNSDDHFESYRDLPEPVRWLFDRGIGDAREVIVQTDEQARRTRDTFGRSPTVIPNGFHPAAEPPLPHGERDFFLWVGRFAEEQKQPHRFLDLAEELPEAEFVLIGGDAAVSGDYYSRRVRERIDELDNVSYPGTVPPDEIHDYYRRAIALINTSRYEGYSSTFPEAWRQHTPVVTLSIPLSKYVDDPVVDTAGSQDTLRDIAERLASDPAYRKRLSDPTHDHFQRHLQFESIGSQYEAALLDT